MPVFMTTNNIKEIAQRLEAVLEEGYFTWVYCQEHHRFRPEVQPHANLRPLKFAKAVHVWDDNGAAGIEINTSIGLVSLVTRIGHGDEADTQFTTPLFYLNGDHIEITYRLPHGTLVHYAFIQEKAPKPVSEEGYS